MGSGLSMASVNKIKELASQREYSLALDIIDSQDLSKSLNSQFLRLCGEIYMREKRYNDARNALIMAHRLAPEGKRIIFTMVDLYLRMGYRDLAKTYYDMYMFEADDSVSNTLLVKYIYEKANGASYETLEEILAPQYSQTMDYDWSFETFLLYVLSEKDDQARQLMELFAATFKTADLCETMDRILKKEEDAVSYFDVYAKEAAEDNDPAYEALRAEEQRLLQNDNLRMNPVEAEIMIEFEEIGSQMSERQMRKLMKKQAKEEAREAAKKEAEAQKAEVGKAKVEAEKAEAQAAEAEKTETDKNEEDKTEAKKDETGKVEAEKTETPETSAPPSDQAEDAKKTAEELTETPDAPEKKGLFGWLKKKKSEKEMSEETPTAAETPEEKPSEKQPEEKPEEEAPAQEEKPEETPLEKKEDDTAERKLTWDDFEKLGEARPSEEEITTDKEEESAPEEVRPEIVYEEVDFTDEEEQLTEADDFSEDEPEQADEELVEEEIAETVEEPVEEVMTEAVWDEEASVLPEPEPEIEEEPEPEPEIEEEPEPEPEIEEEPEPEPGPEIEEEPTDTYEPVILSEAKDPEIEAEPEIEEEPEPELEPEIEQEPEPEVRPEPTPMDFDISYKKSKLEFPKFKTSLFPNYNSEIKHVDNNFNQIVSESNSKLNDNLEKEAQMQREAEELLRSLGIELDTPKTAAPAGDSPEQPKASADQKADDELSREALKKALRIGPDKKDVLKKLKGL